MTVQIHSIEFAVLRCDLCRNEARRHESPGFGDMKTRLEEATKKVDADMPGGWVRTAADRHVCPKCAGIIRAADSPSKRPS